MNKLIAIKTSKDILPEYKNTYIESLLEFHNFKKPPETFENPKLLIGTCMDFRVQLHIPKNFAFMIRNGGANMQYSDFHISYALSVGQIKHMALIGHSDCGMVNITLRKDQFVNGLVEMAGWNKEKAENHFSLSVDKFEIKNAIDFTLSQTHRLRAQYPKITIAPMMFLVEDCQLYIIKE